MDLQVKRPTHIKTGKRTFRHVHNKVERPRDYKQYGQQAKVGSISCRKLDIAFQGSVASKGQGLHSAWRTQEIGQGLCLMTK